MAQHKNRRVRPELGDEEPELEPIIRLPAKRANKKRVKKTRKRQKCLRQNQHHARTPTPPVARPPVDQPVYAGEYGAVCLLERPTVDDTGVGPTSGGDPLAPRRKSRRLARLWRRFGGTCQRCACETMPMFVANRLGWEVFRPFGIVVAPDGRAYAIATVQHILSRALGGTNAPDNLTLYCYNCNVTDNQEVRRRMTLPVRCGADPLVILAKFEADPNGADRSADQSVLGDQVETAQCP